MREVRVGLSIALLLIILPTSTVPALAGDTLFEFERLRGIPVAGKIVRGLTGGGLPWKIAQGQARLDQDGTLEVEVEGLVLAAGPSVDTNPIGEFIATLSCLNADGVNFTNISTSPVPATVTGDASIKEVLTLPDICLAPIVFVQGFPSLRWFAISGF